jgi:hypothetical protein
MRSIQAALAARILRVSRILRGDGTLKHYRGRGTTACAGIAAAASHPPRRHPYLLDAAGCTHTPQREPGPWGSWRTRPHRRGLGHAHPSQ